MEPQNNPGYQGAATTGDAADALRSLTQDVRSLQQSLASQLAQDIERLQYQKARLVDDLEQLQGDYQSLRHEYQALQANHQVALSEQQQAQQQLWAKRLAQALATHLNSRLQVGTGYAAGAQTGAIAGEPPLNNAYQLLSSLDTTLNGTLHSLQQDLNSYQSALSQQISRMHSMEQQGEVILDALVSRLNVQLQTQLTSHPRPAVNSYEPGYSTGYDLPPIPRTPANRFVQPAAAPSTTSNLTPVQKGFILVLIATVALSIHNVVVNVVGNGGQVFGLFSVPQVLPLSLPNALRLLWWRMLFVLPMLALLSTRLYPKTWSDLQQTLSSSDKRPLWQAVGSGCFLFLSQILIYRAIAEVGPAVAVTILFMYPLITVPMAKLLLGEQLTLLRGLVMAAIAMGIIFVAWPGIVANLQDGVSLWGIMIAVLSSVAFAFYLIAQQISFRRINPVPVTLLQFGTIIILSSIFLVFSRPFGVVYAPATSFPSLVIGAIVLAALTLVGYLSQNFGFKFMGATEGSIVASSGPVMTAVLAMLILPGPQSALQIVQILGVSFVTIGVITLGLEKLAIARANRKVPKRVRP